MAQRSPEQVRYLRRRLLRSLGLQLSIFTIIFLSAVFLFDHFLASDVGTWIADNTSEWTVYHPSTQEEIQHIIEDTQESNPYAAWDIQTNPLDGSLWVRDLTVYQVFHDLWLPMALVLYAVGCLVIIVLTLRRSLSYFDELEHAVDALMDDKSKPVELSPELKLTQDHLNAIRERTINAEQASAAAEQRKNELVAYLAHDIKTPLTSVIGYLDLLKQTPRLTPETQSYVSISLDKAERLDDLINELFEIARFNVHDLTIERCPIDLSVLCAQVADEFFPTAQEKGLELSVCEQAKNDEPPGDATISADGDKLARALTNIVRNAVAYAKPGGSVSIQYHVGKDGCQISVSNTGSTIAPEHLDSIFEKFYREDAARSSQQGGAGLGLAIAKEIVEAHGGTIAVASDQGLTTFTISLPTLAPSNS